MSKDYWRECVSCACDEAALEVTFDQIKIMAEIIGNASDIKGEYFYTPSSPVNSEIKILKEALVKERSKIYCRPCDGSGRIVESFGVSHVSNSECWKCNGKGSITP